MPVTTTLYRRLLGIGTQRINPADFTAGLTEVLRGRLPVADLAEAFSLTSAQQDELNGLVKVMRSPRNPLGVAELRDVLNASIAGVAYGDEASVKTRLGV